MGMDTDVRPTDFAAAAGISVPYASQLLSGVRDPSRSLALRIFRATGRKLGPIANATDAQIEVLEALEPASPTPSDAEAA